MKLRIAVCKEVERSSTPIPVPRHIVIPMAICRELDNKILNNITIPNEVFDKVKKDGYIIIENRDFVLKILGIRLNENEYIKISVEGID